MANDSELQLRLERLEKDYRRFRWLAALVVLALGLTPYVERLVRGTPAIEATGFVLKDADGRVRGRLAAVGQDAFAHLYDAQGHLQAVVDAGSHGGSMALYDSRGKMRCSAAAGQHASILLFDEEGKTVFSAPSSDHSAEQPRTLQPE
jgi:hypothetical protein